MKKKDFKMPRTEFGIFECLFSPTDRQKAKDSIKILNKREKSATFSHLTGRKL